MNRSCRHCSPDMSGRPCRESCISTNTTVCYGWGNVRQLMVCARTSQGGSCDSAGMLWAWQQMFYKWLCRCGCNGAAYPELKAGYEPRPARPLISAIRQLPGLAGLFRAPMWRLQLHVPWPNRTNSPTLTRPWARLQPGLSPLRRQCVRSSGTTVLKLRSWRNRCGRGCSLGNALAAALCVQAVARLGAPLLRDLAHRVARLACAWALKIGQGWAWPPRDKCPAIASSGRHENCAEEVKCCAHVVATE